MSRYYAGFVIAIVICLVPLPATADPSDVIGAKQKGRKMKGTYECPCGVQVAGAGYGFITGSGGGFVVPTLFSEKKISIKLVDSSGLPAYFAVAQDLDGDSLAETYAGGACGKTSTPIEIPEPGRELSVFVYSGTCDVGVAVATGGSFAATLHR